MKNLKKKQLFARFVNALSHYYTLGACLGFVPDHEAEHAIAQNSVFLIPIE
jgi:hypothetical protein